MPLIEKLNRKVKSEFVLESQFSKSLNTTIISNNDHETYFKKQKDQETLGGIS